MEHGVGDDSALLRGAEHLVHVLLRVEFDAAVLLAVPAIHITFSHGSCLVYM